MALGQSDIKRGTRATLTDLPGAQNDACPLCGGRLQFRKESTGYGTVLESCEHFDAREGRGCKHWRTVGRRPRPELARRPRGEEPRSAQALARECAMVPRRGRLRGRTPQLLNALVRALPTNPAEARSKAELAAAVKVSVDQITYLMPRLVDITLISRPRPRPGRYGRPILEFWRVA